MVSTKPVRAQHTKSKKNKIKEKYKPVTTTIMKNCMEWKIKKPAGPQMGKPSNQVAQ